MKNTSFKRKLVVFIALKFHKSAAFCELGRGWLQADMASPS